MEENGAGLPRLVLLTPPEIPPEWFLIGDDRRAVDPRKALGLLKALGHAERNHPDSRIDRDALAAAVMAHATRCPCCGDQLPGDNARARLRSAVENLRSATTATERRTAVRNFLAALAELIACLLRFLVRVLILLLSRLLGRAVADDVPVWKPEPIDTSPQITPRGPNSVFPVTNHRGGHHSSCALGSAVLAA